MVGHHDALPCPPMLDAADNRLLTRTGPGTPAGRWMRAHWIPFALASELPRGGALSLTLLCEPLRAHRGTDGTPSLQAGEGPAATRYPCVEHGGLLWTRMAGPGPSNAHARAAIARSLPRLPWTGVPDDWRHASRWLQDCNWAQALEGEIDEAHVGFLHRRMDVEASPLALTGGVFVADTAPRYEVRRTGYGLACGARRVVDGRRLWRINLYLSPFFTLIPPSDDPHSYVGRAWIPADDTHCWVICVSWRSDGPVGAAEMQRWRDGVVAHRRVIPGTTTPLERRDNDYLIDRAAQRTRSFSGIAGVRAQDAMCTESCGAIVDRTREHLGTSDRAVIAFRRHVLGQVRPLQHDPHADPAVPAADAYAVLPVQCWADDARPMESLPQARAAGLSTPGSTPPTSP